MSQTRLLFFLVLALATVNIAQAQTTRYVSTTGTNSDPASATSWATSTTNLQGAIDEVASTSGTVYVAAGTYQPGGTANTSDRVKSFTIASGVTVLGGYVGNPSSDPNPGPRTAFPSSTTLSGVLTGGANRSYHVVQFSNASAQTRLDGFVIKGGLADGSAPDNAGGGIYNLATGSGAVSSPALASLVITENSAAYVIIVNTAGIGGGIYSMASSGGTASPTLTGVLVSQNTASGLGSNQGSGGMSNVADGVNSISSPVLTSVTITQNQGGNGGGIANVAQNSGTASATLTGVLVSQNTAIFSSGGGMYNFGNGTNSISSPVLTNVTITQNRAGNNGGGISNVVASGGTSSARLTSVLVSENVSFAAGGGMNNESFTGGNSSPVLTSVTITQNQGGNGGGIHNNTSSGTASPTLTDVVLSHNRGSGLGGGLYNEASDGTSSPVLTRVTLTQNQALNGGGIYNYAINGGTSSMTLTSGLLSRNTATFNGGGMLNWGFGTITSPALTNVTLTQNSAGNNGGGFYNEAVAGGSTVNPRLTGVLLSQNTATQQGGGMHIFSDVRGISSPVLTNVTITQNMAQSGGGISCSAIARTQFTGAITETLIGTVSPRLTGVLLSQNTATSNGGGLFNGAANGSDGGPNGISNPVLTNVAFANNRANAAGGAIYNTVTGNTSTTLTNVSFGGNSAPTASVLQNGSSPSSLTNAVIFGNTGGGAFGGTGITVGFSLLESSISSLSYTGGGNNLTTTRTPFVDGPNGNLRLNVCTEAINTGSNAANNTALDLDGLPRVVHTTIDMGAYEFGGTLNVFTGITQQPPSGSAVCAGSTVSIPLSVSGTEPLSAQLFRDGQLVNVPSSQTFTFTLSNVTSSSAGNYSVVVTGACNSVTSTVFSLTVNPSPTVTISPNPTLTIGTGQSATLTASGAASYNWSNGQSTTAISVSVAGTYSVTGTTNGCSGTASAVLSVTSAAPIITTQPATASSVCEGASVMVSVVVSNSVTGYQWLKGGSPVPGQNTATLALGNVQAGTPDRTDAGVYSLSVTGPGGSTTSNGFTLTVNPLPTATIIFPNSVTVAGSPVPVVRVPSLNPPVVFQAFGGNTYERMIVLDQVNGYVIRQVDSNTTGIFPINRLGLFTLTVTGAGGCKRTVQWVVQNQ